ncbi:hypothetical protein CC79DRAFT_1360009 [Sarocladium strictum]
MKTTTILSALAAVGSVIATPTKSINEPPTKRDFSNTPKVTPSGTAFYDEDGTRFLMRGIAYQPGGSSANLDPLSNPKVCLRDIKHFENMGINTIRVYSVDNLDDHDECMEALSKAGIYLVLDLNNPSYSINREEPHDSYNTIYIQNVLATVEAFSQYDNMLAFFSGNEVINHEKDTDKTAPYIKALTRDIKNYQRAHGLPRIPVGYSAADTSHNIMEQANYFNCGSDDARADFFAFNDYSWCNTDFLVSGWDKKIQNFTDYGLPIFLSEWGCIENRPRKFDEWESLMHTNTTGVYSGGLMYEYTIEDNEFGIVEVDGNKDNVKTGREYDNLKSALAAYPSPTSNHPAESTTHAVECPSSNSVDWQVNPTLIPSMPKEAEKFFDERVRGEGFGLKGAGSQFRADSGVAEESVESGVPQATGNAANSDDDDDAAMSLHVSVGALTISAVSIFFTLFGAALL